MHESGHTRRVFIIYEMFDMTLVIAFVSASAFASVLFTNKRREEKNVPFFSFPFRCFFFVFIKLKNIYITLI